MTVFGVIPTHMLLFSRSENMAPLVSYHTDFSSLRIESWVSLEHLLLMKIFFRLAVICGFQVGIVGLPNVGKSTLYNTLTKCSIPAENFPFCTIDPNEVRGQLRIHWYSGCRIDFCGELCISRHVADSRSRAGRPFRLARG